VVEKELPNTEYSKTAVELRGKLEKKNNICCGEKETEARIALT
jgi:outer membrane protein assembly factor BamD